MRRKFYYLMAAIVALFCVSFTAGANVTTTSGRVFFVNIPTGDSDWLKDGARIAIFFWGSSEDWQKNLAYTTDYKGQIQDGIYWARMSVSSNNGFTLFRYGESQESSLSDSNKWNYQKTTSGGIQNYYVRKKSSYWDNTDGKGLEWSGQDTPSSFSIKGTSGSGWGSKDFTTVSNANGIWVGQMTATPSDLSGDKFYFRPLIGSKEFGTYSANDDDVSSSKWLGFDCDHAFYIEATAGQVITITVNMQESCVSATATTSGGGGGSDLSKIVNMPLTESDFSKPHYFFVGPRTSGWRLLPEWELTDEDGDGVYELSGRLMYNGQFGIARVDSYDKYIKHQYDAFYTKNFNLYKGDSNITWNSTNSTATGTVTLSTSTAMTGCVSAINEGAGKDAVAWWMLSECCPKMDNGTISWYWPYDKYNASSSDTNPRRDEIMAESMPCYLTKMTFTPGSSSGDLYVSVDCNRSNVAEHLSFTFSGSKIRYDADENYSIVGAGWYTNTASDGHGWGDSWYSWDEDGKVYIDGNGNPLYLTAYDEEWMQKHSSNFYDSDKDFYYSSKNLTFVSYTQLDDYQNDPYIGVYMAHPYSISGSSDQIGGVTIKTVKDDSSNWNYDETFRQYSTQYYNPQSANWKCFVVKDVWLDGDFKVWTGWGGASSTNEWSSKGGTDVARWFTQNGGHGRARNDDDLKNTSDPTSTYGVASTDLESGKTYVYGTKRDIYGADFRIITDPTNTNLRPTAASEKQYYKRVLLWYNTDQGFENSVLQFISELDGPQIRAMRKEGVKNQLQYAWRIDAQNVENPAEISLVKIQRYCYNSTTGTFVADGSAITVSDAVGKTTVDYKANIGTSPNTYSDDTNTCSAGRYYYTIEVTYSNGVTKTANSNEITINYGVTPVTISVSQLKDSDSKLRLGVTLTAKPNADGLNRDYTHNGSTQKASVVAGQKIIIIPYSDMAKTIAALETLAEDGATTGWFDTGSEAYDTHAYAASESTSTYKIPANTRYYATPYTGTSQVLTLDFTKAPANTGVTETRGNYQYLAILVAGDGDEAAWETLNYTLALGSTDVELPAPAISHSGLTIKK
ncbi:MAG: hypothetical protein LIP02_12435 [Bacteroidales bacterium]|nr:hypothetical protein [Bacteroidales bacterium]